jgi:mannose-6-phosphate isomerase
VKPYNPQDFDATVFTQAPYVRRIEKPWGYELHLVSPGMPYMGKIMHVNAGARMSLQVHDVKQETYLIMNGRGKLVWENNARELVETELQPGVGYTSRVGQKHRLCGITDCDIIEFSMPEQGTTWRLEDDYKRPDETPEQRAKERQGM